MTDAKFIKKYFLLLTDDPSKSLMRYALIGIQLENKWLIDESIINMIFVVVVEKVKYNQRRSAMDQ